MASFLAVCLAGDCLAQWPGNGTDQDARQIMEALRRGHAAPGASPDGIGINGVDVGSLMDDYAVDFDAADQAARLPPVLVFVSSSMPGPSIKAAARDAAKVGGAVVIRGLIGGSMAQTQQFFSDVFGDEKLGLLVDPRLFTTFRVESVPVVMVAERGIVPCEPQDDQCEPLPGHDVVRGNVTLRFALRTIAEAGGPGAIQAKTLLPKLGETQ